MDALEECMAVYANLVVRMKELDELRGRLSELRGRVEKAKTLFTPMPAPLKQEPSAFTDGLPDIH
jgi:hypothetical protein